MRKISYKEKYRHFIINNFSFRKSCRFELIWKNTGERGRPQMTIWRMRIAYSIPKATNTHSEYVILTAFPLQQRLHKRASMLRYTYIVCLFRLSQRYCSGFHSFWKRFSVAEWSVTTFREPLRIHLAWHRAVVCSL